ncbi:helix-turn-helix transcriptional regulator [Planococcus sp. X10-3]|uniref:helix-turn-helix transcriptional regulator n=1 Tax=Planococcus sp. X10-3 TaxID=3061240 RepID=UPI003BB1CD38
MTQSQVASKAFIDRGYYSQIETGKRNPGLNIAINIAKVLDFDSIMFYQEHLDHTSIDKSADYQITEYFRSKESGEILYLYNSLENHLQHAMSFLVSGVAKKSDCLFIDYQKNHDSIQAILGNILSASEILRHIHFINKEEIDDLDIYKTLPTLPVSEARSGELKHFHIWLSEDPHEQNEWLRKLEYYLNARDMKLNKEKVLFVRSYNAALITAGMHIKMMRNYPYLMTDNEIVDSPFYKAGNRSTIFPSLFIQENI